MSTMSSLNISISINIRRKLTLMLMSRLSSLAHKLLMLVSLVRTGLYSLAEKPVQVCIYRSASELSGFTCTSSLTMNEKFSIPHEAASCGIENFEFIVGERAQVNPDNSRAMSVLTFLLFKLNTLQTEIVKL